jgi:hypothetical protein
VIGRCSAGGVREHPSAMPSRAVLGRILHDPSASKRFTMDAVTARWSC